MQLAQSTLANNKPPPAAAHTQVALGGGGPVTAAPGFWEGSDAEFAGQHAAGDHEFSELVAIKGAEGSGKARQALLYVLMFLVLGAAGYSAYQIFVNDKGPFDDLGPLWDDIKGLFGDAPAEAPPPVKHAKVSHAVATPPPQAPAIKPANGNPYWSLPNAELGYKAPLGISWSPEEEETLRAGIIHRFTYQRFKTVQDVRRDRHRGTDAILMDALQDRKLWTRMSALMGMAEFHLDVPTKTVEQALGKDRSELVANYFERYVGKATAPQLYVMRTALRLVDERGRLVILKAIAASDDGFRNLYLAAATLDAGPHVQQWLPKALQKTKMSVADLTQMVALAKGDKPVEPFLKSIRALGGAVASPAAADKDGAEGDDDDDSDGDNVEFFAKKPDNGKQVDADKPDGATFEYAH